MYYQKDSTDQYIHRYCYDEDNRLKEVYTSKEGSIWDRDAKYFYYKHGPPARVERGEYLVQGEDYVYTINGWIKGYNSATLDSARDIGKDGGTDYVAYYDSLHRFVGRDSLGWILGYFDNDFTAVSNPAAGVNFEAAYVGTTFGGRGGDLFNGNIRHVVSAIGGMDIHGNVYNYDQLQRIRRADVYAGLNTAGNTWGGATLQSDYASRYTYDANGNLLTMTREGAGTGMDDLTYHYVSGKNRLEYVDDAEAGGNYSFDIDDQASGNYEYWNNGALKADAHDEIDSIAWTVDRKVKGIYRTSSSNMSQVEFEYDAFGNRILKIEKPLSSGTVQGADTWEYTYYMRDAAGNVMAVYDYTTGGDKEFWIAERNIYGAGRLGVLDEDKQLAYYDEGTSTLTLYDFDDTTRTLGKKIYEFAGHNNDIHLTTTDRTVALNDGTGTIYGYLPDVNSTSDYYPFGLQKPNRNNDMGSYRYAFQGMETDPEKTGSEGGSYNYTYRMHDPRIGRFFAVDPLVDSYPFWSPYSFSGNRVIDMIELEGLEPTRNRKFKFTNRRWEVLRNLTGNAGSVTQSFNNRALVVNTLVNGPRARAFILNRFGASNGSMRRVQDIQVGMPLGGKNVEQKALIEVIGAEPGDQIHVFVNGQNVQTITYTDGYSDPTAHPFGATVVINTMGKTTDFGMEIHSNQMDRNGERIGEPGTDQQGNPIGRIDYGNVGFSYTRGTDAQGNVNTNPVKLRITYSEEIRVPGQDNPSSRGPWWKWFGNTSGNGSVLDNIASGLLNLTERMTAVPNEIDAHNSNENRSSNNNKSNDGFRTTRAKF